MVDCVIIVGDYPWLDVGFHSLHRGARDHHSTVWHSISTLADTGIDRCTHCLCLSQSKPWLLFVWSILMIFMLLIDGIITILSLRQHQQQVGRLVASVCIEIDRVCYFI